MNFGYERDAFPLKGLRGYDDVDIALPSLAQPGTFAVPPWWWVLSSLSMAASAYHGYKRNAGDNPLAWALVWGLLGAAFPVITPAIALAEGFGERAK